MELHLLPILALLCLVLVGSNASTPAEDYWHSVLPNTPMPKAIQDLLQLDAGNESPDAKKFSNIKKIFPPFYHFAQDDIDVAKSDLALRTQFYKYNSIHPGQKFTLLFDNAGNKVPFLPREVAETVPFSSDRLQDILQLFSIDPNSPEAPIVADTIKICEGPKRREEEKYCANSLESLVDQNVARLGKNISLVSTPVAKRQEYTILPGIKMVANDRISICHRERYPYALYYCHETEETELYRVPLLGADGTRLSAVTICHKDTSGWNQGFIAFVILKMEKPGPPVCHFVAGDTLVWFRTSDLGHVSV